MKRFLTMLLALVLIGTTALADAEAVLNDTLELVRGMNESLSADPDGEGSQIDYYYAYDDSIHYSSQDNALTLDVLPAGGWEGIRMLTLIARDAAHVDAALSDVEYLAYAFGSNDSIEAAHAWTEQWSAGIKEAIDGGSELSTGVLQCAALVAMGTVVVEDGAAYLKITVML